jgi:hypothetical protein
MRGHESILQLKGQRSNSGSARSPELPAPSDCEPVRWGPDETWRTPAIAPVRGASEVSLVEPHAPELEIDIGGTEAEQRLASDRESSFRLVVVAGSRGCRPPTRTRCGHRRRPPRYSGEGHQAPDEVGVAPTGSARARTAHAGRAGCPQGPAVALLVDPSARGAAQAAGEAGTSAGRRSTR